jgi:signal peptidase I
MTEGPRHIDSVLRLWTKSILLAIGIWLVLRTFLVEAYRIPSGSMEQTLLVGDLLFVNKALYGAEIPLTRARLPAIRGPRRGDIVIFDSVEEPGRAIVKRIVGLPGDTVAMRHGALIRNGQPVNEPYVVHVEPDRSEAAEERDRMRAWQLPHLVGADPGSYDPDVSDWGPLVIPPDSFFVLGDNREDSVDSRYWGLVPRGNVRGHPLFVYFSYDAARWRSAPFFSSIRWRRIFSIPE